MYLEKITFDNRAPFEHLEIDFKNNGVNVLTAINGKGKTSILSHIADAFYELARPAYPQEFEGKENKLYRVSSELYNMTSGKPSIIYSRFKDGEDIYDYIDVRGKCTKEQYDNTINVNNKIDYNNIQGSLKQQNFTKYWNIQEKTRNSKIGEPGPSCAQEETVSSHDEGASCATGTCLAHDGCAAWLSVDVSAWS